MIAQTIAVRPPAISATALAWTSASVSCWSARRSLWPTMTRVAPASFSIATDTQPVCAPLSRSCTSCAPMATPVSRATAAAIRVKGGHTATSTDGWARAASAMPSSSASAASVPFIFQLPATSLRRAISIPFRPVPNPQGPYQPVACA